MKRPGLRVVYLAHPVSGDVPGNLARARRWLAWAIAAHADVAPIAPWITQCEVQDDAHEKQRARGLRDDCAVVARCDELWLVGGRISAGMRLERVAAEDAGVLVVDLTRLGEEPPARAA